MKPKYKNRKYEVTVLILSDPGPPIVLPVGTSQKGSATIVNVPFILKRVTHEIIGFNQLETPNTIPNALIQDGQYFIDWQTDRLNYQGAPIASGAGFGTEFDHFETDTPEELSPKTTIELNVTNGVERFESLRVQVVFHGLEPVVEEQDQ